MTNPSPLAATMLEELQKAYAPYPAIVSAEAIKRGEALVERWAAERDALEQKALMIQDERDELLALRDGRVSEALPKGVTGPAGDSTTSVLMEPHAARPSGDLLDEIEKWLVDSAIMDERGILPTRKPTHGTCCTCQSCGHGHDECVCDSNQLWKEWREKFRADRSPGKGE